MLLELTEIQTELVFNAVRAEINKGQHTFLGQGDVDQLLDVLCYLKGVNPFEREYP